MSLTIEQNFKKLYNELANIKEQIDLNAIESEDIPFVDKYSDNYTDEVIKALADLGYSEEDYNKMMEDFEW